MKYQPHQREKKALSAAGLLNLVRKSVSQIPSPKRERDISFRDCLMSALAIFSLKFPSLLAFDDNKADPVIQHNLKTLFEVENAPCDTYMREVLDEVDPRQLRQSYLSIFHEAQRGKLLERYEFLNGHYLCLVDGTELFSSEKIHCKNCCKKEHKDGRITYHHQLLGAVIAKPGLRQVIPLCPEPITKQDGETKNDCERNAFRRMLIDLRKEHPRLKLTIVCDALSANAVHIRQVEEAGYGYIVVVKPDGNKTLFEYVKGVMRTVEKQVLKNKYTFRYINQVPINDTKNAPNTNFIECEWEESKGKKISKGSCSWGTSHEITDENVYELMLAGRSRWKIENETFNTLKNQGYQFEHNFGHGKKNLHTVFALLMMLAFLIDQIQEASCGLFQTAMGSGRTRQAMWRRMRSFFEVYLVESWVDLFEVIGRRRSFKGVKLVPNTS
jgi:hypothetical protein